MQLSRLIALVIVVVLGGAAAFSLRSGPGPEAEVTAPSTVPSTSVQPSVTARLAPIAAAVVTTTSMVHRDDDVEAVAAEGLAAWGRFAASGDLAEVSSIFALGGPQMARFEEEASEAVGGPPYAVTFEEQDRVLLGEEARVSGVVRFVRTGEPTQSFRWTVVLRRMDGEWSIWTVEETEPATG